MRAYAVTCFTHFLLELYASYLRAVFRRFPSPCELVLHVPIFPIMTTAPYVLVGVESKKTIPELFLEELPCQFRLEKAPSSRWPETPIFTNFG
ncbi:hypothetical protein CJ030_MR2G016412 [Morella rubra]|uniref:Uncharacterized protein n=1 Tax=Morella rubra TaxID=262757 RepID=A0A6A1WI57_9ROSI|nr:hypothetical protein CJ030_MR2G016412 [Morella rubra]